MSSERKNTSEVYNLGVMLTAFEIIRRAAAEAGKAVTYTEALELIRGQLAMIDEALAAVGGPDIPAVTCYTASCDKVPTHRVDWLGKPLHYCEDCAKRTVAIGTALGMTVIPEAIG